MASRFLRSCSPGKGNRPALRRPAGVPTPALALLWCLALAPCAAPQFLIKPSEPGEQVRIMPSDLTILESGDERKDLPCTVTQHKPELGFDLRFHGGYEVTMPLRELSGSGEVLTILFRVAAQDDRRDCWISGPCAKRRILPSAWSGPAFSRGPTARLD